MRDTRVRITLAAALLAGASAGAHAGEDKPVNLLRLPSARVETASVPGLESLRSLTDGDPATLAEAPATGEAPLEIVFGFGGADVAPEGVRVTLGSAPEGAPAAARVEVLVSTASAHAGFRAARADPLVAAAKPPVFEFLPVHARWILVRLTPAAGARRLSVAEVEVLGREGLPASRYAFAESPARALDVLQRLERASTLKVGVSAEEKALFERARAGRLDARGLAEAALFASGVTQAARRAAYLKRLDELEGEARKAVAKASGPAAQGEALLRWMHQGPLAKGYVAQQTDLSVVLDTGTFNCVSSAALFNCLALRLGLDARAIEVPTHAFSIVYEGTRHKDVETTTPDGFDPSRDPAVVERFEQATGFRYIRDTHREERREVEEAGLAALIYYNHGVQLAEAKRHHEALLAFFRAMSLDPEFGSAVKGALGVLAGWGIALAEGGKPEAALEVIGTGLSLAPKDAALRNNRLWVWQRWAEGEIDAGRPDEALAILTRAARDVPDGGFEERKAWVYLKPGEAHVAAGRWQEALAAVEPGLARLEGRPRDEVVGWRVNLYGRWFSAEVRAQRFEAAAAVLERGLAALPGQPALTGSTGYLAQEWAKALAERGQHAEALAALRALRQRFAGSEPVADAAANHARRVAYAAADAGRHEEALAAIEEAADLLPDADARRKVEVYVFDGWAKAHMKAGAWTEAADVYVRARRRHPQDGLLRQNVAYLAQEWSKAAYQKGGAAEAARVSKVLQEKFPDVTFAAKSSANELRRVVQELVGAGKYQEALRALEEGRALLAGEKDAEETWVFVYDGWARAEIAAGRWEGAADAYAAGLARLPGNRGLVNNLGYLAQEWAKNVAAGDPVKAVEVLRALKARFPDVEDVAESARRHVRMRVQERAQRGEFEPALADLESWKDLLKGASDVGEAAAGVYDRWARGFVDRKAWQEAVDVYAKALERHPESGHLKSNAVATWYQWAKTFSDEKRWDEAIAVYDKGLERMPDTRLFKQNRAWCEAQKKQGK